MLQINLLGKKKKALPFGLDKVLDKAGITESQIEELKPSLPKVALIVVGLFLADYIPTYMFEQRMAELQTKQEAVSKVVGELRKELGSLRKVRQEMERLQKEEADVVAQLNTIEGLSKGRQKAFNTMNGIVELLPEKVWMDSFDFDQNAINIKGGSWEYFPVNDFVRSLMENTKIEAVTLRSIRAQAAKVLEPGIPAADQKTKEFQVEMLVRE